VRFLNAFSHSTLGKRLLLDELPFPEDKVINGNRTPYFIIGDDAFPLHKRIMKPYSGKDLHRKERIFNYRLSRARRCIENAFGIFSARWMAVQRTLLSNPSKSQKVIAACCAHPNFFLFRFVHWDVMASTYFCLSLSLSLAYGNSHKCDRILTKCHMYYLKGIFKKALNWIKKMGE